LGWKSNLERCFQPNTITQVQRQKSTDVTESAKTTLAPSPLSQFQIAFILEGNQMPSFVEKLENLFVHPKALLKMHYVENRNIA
jgi:hypothetical protein